MTRPRLYDHPCRCDAYQFPHRKYGGRCAGPYLWSIDDGPRRPSEDDELRALDSRDRARDMRSNAT